MSKNIKEFDFFGVRSIPFEFSASLCNRTMSEALFLSLENVEHLLPLLALQYRQFHALAFHRRHAVGSRQYHTLHRLTRFGVKEKTIFAAGYAFYRSVTTNDTPSNAKKRGSSSTSRYQAKALINEQGTVSSVPCSQFDCRVDT